MAVEQRTDPKMAAVAVLLVLFYIIGTVTFVVWALGTA